jgi:hypothetical protein
MVKSRMGSVASARGFGPRLTSTWRSGSKNSRATVAHLSRRRSTIGEQLVDRAERSPYRRGRAIHARADALQRQTSCPANCACRPRSRPRGARSATVAQHVARRVERLLRRLRRAGQVDAVHAGVRIRSAGSVDAVGQPSSSRTRWKSRAHAAAQQRAEQGEGVAPRIAHARSRSRRARRGLRDVLARHVRLRPGAGAPAPGRAHRRAGASSHPARAARPAAARASRCPPPPRPAARVIRARRAARAGRHVERLHRLARAEDASSRAGGRPTAPRCAVEDEVVGRVLDHADLFEDHLALEGEIASRRVGWKIRSPMTSAAFEVLVEHARLIRRVLALRVGIERPAERLEREGESRALRDAVPLNTMCSSRCDTPICSACSCSVPRAPRPRTQPTALPACTPRARSVRSGRSVRCTPAGVGRGHRPARLHRAPAASTPRRRGAPARADHRHRSASPALALASRRGGRASDGSAPACLPARLQRLHREAQAAALVAIDELDAHAVALLARRLRSSPCARA